MFWRTSSALCSVKLFCGSGAGLGSLPSLTKRWRSSRNCCCNLAARALSSDNDRARTFSSAAVFARSVRGMVGSTSASSAVLGWVKIALTVLFLLPASWPCCSACFTVRSKFLASSGERLMRLPLLAVAAAWAMRLWMRLAISSLILSA